MLALLGLLAFIAHPAYTRAPEDGVVNLPEPDPAEGTAVTIAPPPVEQNTCQHCHLEGEDTGIWTPTARWGVFGLAGLVFVFGLYRSASTWVSRDRWKPLLARATDYVEERYSIKEPLEKVLKKPVPRFATQWFYCLGGITAFLFVVQGLTGIMLAFYYKPTPDEAYASIQFIETQVRFGASIRAIHHWAANGMIVMCVAHAFRVFITGAYKAPRELNWVGGTLLLLMTLAFGFTGYLLPWDQRAYWATTVGTEIAGGVPDLGIVALIFLRAGWAVTEATLSRFYAVHIFALPLVTVALMGLHFLMIRRQGVAEPL
nr:cytochrome b N-terminal domain-containing protein [Anaerolineae bacterium]